MKRIIPLLLLFLLSFGVKAQFSLAVQGTVSTNNSAASVAGILVELYYDSVPGAVFPGPFFTHTNPNGFFTDTILGVPNAMLKARVLDCNGSYLTQQRVVLPNVPVATINFSNYCAAAAFGCNPAFTGQASAANPFQYSFLLNQGPVAPSTTLMWSFGDGSSNTTIGIPNISHIYVNAGTYLVSVLMIDSINGCNAVFSDSVRVFSQGGGGGSQCSATFNAGQFPLPGLFNNIRFHINSFSSPSGHLRLDFGDGFFVSGQVGTIFTADHIYQTPGVYVPCITVIDSTLQCFYTFCDTLVVNTSGQGNCHAAFQASYTPGNAPVSVSFHNQSSGASGNPFGFSSQWNFGDGNFSSAANPSHVYTANGSYRVTLVVFDSIFNCTSTYVDSIYIGSSSVNCAASFVHTVLPQPGGAIVSFIHQTNAPGPHNYAWNFGNGQIVNQDHPVTFLPNGVYNVCFTVVSLANGCTATYCDTVVVGSTTNCNASFNATVPSGNAPVTVSFSNSSTGTSPNTLYHWDFGDGTTNTGFMQNHIYTANGTYVVTLSMFDTAQSCHSIHTDTIVIGNIPQSCQAFFSSTSSPANPNTLSFSNLSTSNATAGVWYQWSFGDGSPIVATANPTHTYTAPGTYTVCLTINTPNCTDAYCMSVTVGQVSSNFNLGGMINGPTPGIGNVIKVYLFEVQTNGGWIPTDTVTAMDTAGFFYYTFGNQPSATYAVLAELTPNSPQGTLFFPTYVGNTVNWNNAILIYLNSQTSLIPWSINMVNFLSLPTGGGGSISGNVLRGNLRVASGNMPNVTVQLLDANQGPIRTSRTDAQGQFNFLDLPLGSYFVHIDYPGRPCTPIAVNLTSGQTTANGINFTMNRGNILTSVQEAFAGSVDKVYPNPVRDQLFAEINLNNDGAYQLEIYNLSGQRVMTETRNLLRGNQRLEIPTQDLSSGLYLMRLTDPQGAATQWKVSKQ